jgi:hypothetical protein
VNPETPPPPANRLARRTEIDPRTYPRRRDTKYVLPLSIPQALGTRLPLHAQNVVRLLVAMSRLVNIAHGNRLPTGLRQRLAINLYL